MRNYLILKGLCTKIYYAGFGNFWYEDDVPGKDNSLGYRLYGIALLSIYGFMTVLEIMVATSGELPEDEKSDSVTFAGSHTIVMVKIFSVIYHKKCIKSLNYNMVKTCEKYEETSLMNEKSKLIKITVIAYFSIVYGSVLCYVFEGLRKVKDGDHFITIVTYYPAYDDNSASALGFRIFTTFVLMCMMMSMIISVDSFALVHLISFKYKLITLRHYFEKLQRDYDKLNSCNNARQASAQLTKGVVEGLIMHKDLLRLFKNIDTSFGTVLTMQLCLSLGSAVSLLLQMALADQLTLTACLKIIFFVTALFFLLGLFLCNAGEITYQAYLMSDAIFYCGWHSAVPLPPPHRNVRKMVLQALTQAQRPLIIKAFKMIPLTYSTFIMVLRNTYSVFALIYAQNRKPV